jgi:hypothetical protein
MQHIEVIRREMIEDLRRQYNKDEVKAYLSELVKMIRMTDAEVFKFMKDRIS